MSNNQHTPGPWKEVDGFIVGGPWADGEFHDICDPRCAPPDDDNIGMINANARLIAAAPDLLKTCRFLLKRAQQLSAGTKAIDGLIPDARMDLELDIEDASKLIDRIEGGAE
jgi:hypothetical protein